MGDDDYCRNGSTTNVMDTRHDASPHDAVVAGDGSDGGGDDGAAAAVRRPPFNRGCGDRAAPLLPPPFFFDDLRDCFGATTVAAANRASVSFVGAFIRRPVVLDRPELKVRV